MKKNALIIMAKAPEPGKVKTRLRGHLSDARRVELYEELLSGTVDRLGHLPTEMDTDTFITYTPAAGEDYFRRFNLPVFVQEGDGLGARMHLALSHVLLMGYGRALIVGADIPLLGPKEIEEAIGLQDMADVVFGPALDGGYYLVGMKEPHREVFHGIRWSTPETLKQSLDKVAAAGLSSALGPVLRDLDTPHDLAHSGLAGLL